MAFPLLGVIGSILGSPKVIDKGMELIDDAFESDEEKRESKTKAKVDLLKAYAPFKVAQRYLALMFGCTYIFSFFLVLGMTLMGKVSTTDDVFKVLSEFYVGEIMLAIVAFYFGGGLSESIGRARNKGAGG